MAKETAKVQKIVKYADLTSTAIRFWRICGIAVYIDDKKRNTEREDFRCKLILIAHIVNLSLTLVGEMLFSAVNWGSTTKLDEFVLSLGFIVFGYLAIVKIYINYLNRGKITELLTGLNKLFPIDVKKQKDYEIQEYLDIYHWRYKPYAYVTFVLASVHNITPMLTYYILTYWMDSVDAERKVPYYVWVPWNATWSYFIIYILNMFAGYTSVSSQVACDSLLYGTVSQINMHYNYLAKTIRAYICHGDIEDFRFWSRAIAYHQNILHLSNLVNEIFHISLFFNFLTSSLLICCLGFQLTIKIQPNLLAFALVFLCCSLLQVYFMSLYGEELLTASTSVGAAIFEHNWYNADIRYKKMLSLGIQRAQQPAMLKTTFFVITLETFTELIQMSYKFLALLRTMYAE